jgi:hypothetical protein
MKRDDVERIIENVLRNLSLEVESSGFTDPNRRTIVLKLDGKVITSTTFDVVQMREYEG